MRRTSVVVAFALAGCMRIYADPELPDLDVNWYATECGDGTVAIAADGLDDASQHFEARVPCSDVRLSFDDVPRERYHVDGTLFDGAGNTITTSESEADLRNGFDEEVGLYFGQQSNFHVAWRFAGGASCTSLAATMVSIAMFDGSAPIHTTGVPCEFLETVGTAPDGAHSMHVTATRSDGMPVAQSIPIDVVIDSQRFSELGTIELAPP